MSLSINASARDSRDGDASSWSPVRVDSVDFRASDFSTEVSISERVRLCMSLCHDCRIAVARSFEDSGSTLVSSTICVIGRINESYVFRRVADGVVFLTLGFERRS